MILVLVGLVGMLHKGLVIERGCGRIRHSSFVILEAYINSIAINTRNKAPL